jgi:opacity protein-like surface antigen
METLWPILQPILAGQLRHFATVAAGALIANGAIDSADENAFVKIVAGIGMWAIIAGWSWYQKVGQAKLLALVARAPAVKLPVSASTGEVINAAKAIVAVLLVAIVLLACLAAPSKVLAGDVLPAAPAVIPAPTLKALASSSSPCAVATASTPLSCSGFYAGGGLSGQGSNADIIGSGVNGSVFAGGMVPSVDAGYQYVQGNWLFAAEFDAGYAFSTNVTINSAASSMNGLRFTELFKVGGNLAGLLGTQAPITVPAALANSVLGLYGGVGPSQWQLGGRFVVGTTSVAGVLFDVSPRIFGDLRYGYTNFNGASAGGVSVQNDQSVRVSINYKF